MQRNLQAFSQNMKQPEVPSAVLRRRRRLYLLVNSETWQDLKEITAEVVSPSVTAIPNANGGLGGVIGYFTFSVIRDALNQFVELVEREAQLAPSLEEFLE